MFLFYYLTAVLLNPKSVLCSTRTINMIDVSPSVARTAVSVVRGLGSADRGNVALQHLRMQI